MQSPSKQSTDLEATLASLSKDVGELKVSIKELQEDNASAAVNAEQMFKTLNAKLDIFRNLETQSRETLQQQTSSASRKLTRPRYFKELFTTDRNKYLNVLYTQAEIDEAFQSKEVVVKKKEADRISKVASILYTTHIKGDTPEGRASAFASMYNQAFS